MRLTSCCTGRPLVNAEDIEALILAKLASGELPSVKPEKVWGGKGTGQPCSACARPISTDDVEYELDFAAARTAMRLHQRCLAIWDKFRDDSPPRGVDAA